VKLWCKAGWTLSAIGDKVRVAREDASRSRPGMSQESSPTIPAGFKLMLPNDGFMANNGPYYLRRLEEGGYDYGFQSDARHRNPNNVLHGGAIIGFLDTIMGHFAAASAKRPTATIGFDTRFLAGARPGAWIEGRVAMRRLTRTLAFVDGEAIADGTLLVTASGIFKVFEA
jgi:acyl-coenzyme A thioesterase PaaI-like protein